MVNKHYLALRPFFETLDKIVAGADSTLQRQLVAQYVALPPQVIKALPESLCLIIEEGAAAYYFEEMTTR